jgi:6-phosphogluconolactonase
VIAVVAGGYAEPGGEGLYPLSYDPARERLTAGAPIPSFQNVSAGLRVPGSDRWLFVDEAAGRIVAAAGPPSGWKPLARVASGGEAPCHLALDPAGRFLAVANYGSGTVALVPLDPASGLPLDEPAVAQHEGQGPNEERQEGPHAHWVGFGPNGLLYATDLGTDRVLAYAVDPERGLVQPPDVAYAAPPGSGPRQIAWHPALPLAYLVSELASTVTRLRIDDKGRLTEPRILSTLPADATEESLAGAIVGDAAGRRLYISNRGHDSVAAFGIDADGDLSPIGHAPSGGSSPRFLLLLEDEGRLLVAHEKQGGVTALAIDADGRLQPTAARANVPGAAFLALSGDMPA